MDHEAVGLQSQFVCGRGVVSRETAWLASVGARSPEPGARSPEPGARSPEPGARSPEPGARSPEPGARSPEPGAFHVKHLLVVDAARGLERASRLPMASRAIGGGRLPSAGLASRVER